MDLDEALDRLYAAPLESFTSTRNELTKDVGALGPKVKSLRKPNLAAWAVNQLARKHPDELEKLFDATQRLRLAQRRVLSGGKASPLREATDERGRLVNELTKRAAAILSESGHAVAQATLSGVSSSLRAIAGDEEAAELVRKGRLTRELQAESVVSVDHGAGLTLVEGDGEQDADEEAPDREHAIRAVRAAVNEARDRVQQSRKAVREADAEVAERTREADDAERAAKAAREAAEFARRASEARRAEVEEAAKALEAAEQALDEADRD